MMKDIKIRKRKGDESVWLSQRLIIEIVRVSVGYLTVARSKYKKGCKKKITGPYLPDTGKSWRWAKIQGKFYYCLDNIPNNHPTCYRSLLEGAEVLKKIIK